MTVFSGAVLFAVIWFLALLTILPLGVRTQGEDGHVVGIVSLRDLFAVAEAMLRLDPDGAVAARDVLSAAHG